MTARPTPGGRLDRERCDLIRHQNRCIVGAAIAFLVIGAAIWCLVLTGVV